MASSDVDQKYLGRLAVATATTSPLVSNSLFQLLGLSVVLSRKLFRARKLRRLDTSRDTKSLSLYHQIVWLSREGVSILEVCVLAYVQNGEQGPECQVLATKLYASFFHIFCLFHNNPPITSASAQPGSLGFQSLTPLILGDDDGQRRARSGGSEPDREDSMPRRSSRDSKGKKPLLRDPIDSITSDASFLTNPYAGIQPGTTPPPGFAPQVTGFTPSLPPGLAPIPPKPSAFLLPAINFIPLTSQHFRAATSIASSVLAGAHPLRLSVAIEHAVFLWDCVHDHGGARQLARRAIRDLRQGEEEGVTDEGFEDAAEMVGILGRIMRRKSWEGTAGIGTLSSPVPVAAAAAMSTAAPNTSPSFSPTAPPTAPIPTTPRRTSVLREPENRSTLEAGPIGGSSMSPSRKRRESNGSNGHGHKRSTSYSTTTQANTPRERIRTSGESLPRVSNGNGSSRVVKPQPPTKDVKTPPRLPSKDKPSYGTPSMATPSKQNTPSTKTGSKQTPSQRIASQKTPLREQGATGSRRYHNGSRADSGGNIINSERPVKISPLRPGRDNVVQDEFYSYDEDDRRTDR